VWPGDHIKASLLLIPAATMPFSTPAEVFAEARKIVDNKVKGPFALRAVRLGARARSYSI
jgi:hypothetical protein